MFAWLILEGKVVKLKFVAASAVLAISMPHAGVVAAMEPASNGSSKTFSASGSRLVGKTNVERALGKCAASLLGGALLGALIGKAAGDTGKGAAIGAAAGGVVCAIMLKVASDKDKQQLRLMQLEALNSNSLQTASWTSDEGDAVTANITPTGTGNVVVADKGSLTCRADDYCKVGDSWFARNDIINNIVDPTSPRVIPAGLGNARVLQCRRTSTSVKVDDQDASQGTDVACLVGDTWVTGDELKKRKIREEDIRI
jgi:hypothetical protein